MDGGLPQNAIKPELSVSLFWVFHLGRRLSGTLLSSWVVKGEMGWLLIGPLEAGVQGQNQLRLPIQRVSAHLLGC